MTAPGHVEAIQGLARGGMAAALARSAVAGLGSNSAVGRVLARSALSDEISNVYALFGKGPMFDKLRKAGVCDADVEAWIESSLTGEDQILARLIARYGPETMWPKPVEEYQAPFDVNAQSSAGERILFNGNYIVVPDAIDHYHELVATGTNGTFDAQGGPATKTFRAGTDKNRIDTHNFSFFIPEQFKPGDSCSVKIEIKARSTGHVLHTKTWTFKPRSKPPTELKQLESGNDEFDIPGVYSYKAGPPIKDATAPFYEHQTVLEEFASRSSNLQIADMDPEWLKKESITDKAGIDAKLFAGSSNNGTFVFDKDDKIYDQHGGGQAMLDEAAKHLKTPKEIHVDLPQTYTAGPGNVLGLYTIRRMRKTDGTYKVRKWRTGP